MDWNTTQVESIIIPKNSGAGKAGGKADEMIHILVPQPIISMYHVFVCFVSIVKHKPATKMTAVKAEIANDLSLALMTLPKKKTII